MTDILGQIVARLNSEAATDLSDETLRRCLITTVGGKRLVLLAKQYRDAGLLRASHLYHLLFEDTPKE